MITNTVLVLAALSLSAPQQIHVSPPYTRQKVEAAGGTCRSPVVKHRFDVKNGYPHGRPALKGEEPWVVDHWCALECGGLDTIINMVYQQYTESKIKDLRERTPKGCAETCTPFNSLPYRTVFNCK